MKAAKKSKITYEKLQDTSSFLKAIAHPLRISILNLLSENKQLSVTELHKKLDVEQAVASHHLAILKSKGITDIKREGKHVFYFIAHSKITSLIKSIEKL